MELMESLESTLPNVVDSDCLLPSQYFTLVGKSQFNSGERALMVAILADAIYCYLHLSEAKSQKKRMLFKEAQYWITSRSKEFFSFDNICQTLGVDSGQVRTALARQLRQLKRSKARDAVQPQAPSSEGSWRGAAGFTRASFR